MIDHSFHFDGTDWELVSDQGLLMVDDNRPLQPVLSISKTRDPVTCENYTCPECYGTGYRHGFGRPCSKC